MSIAKQAIDEADSIISTIFGIARDAVRERRSEAAWWYAYRSRRAVYARTRVARRFWQWLARRSRAQMDANECCLVDDAIASLPRYA